MILSGRDHHAPPTLPLTRRVNRQHPEVAALATQFRVDASDDAARLVLRDKKVAFLYHFPHAHFICASAFKERFDRKR